MNERIKEIKKLESSPKVIKNLYNKEEIGEFLKLFRETELLATLGFKLLPCQFKPIFTLLLTSISVSHSRSLLSLILIDDGKGQLLLRSGVSK